MMESTTKLANFYCGKCGKEFKGYDAREEHKMAEHADYYAALVRAIATPLEARTTNRHFTEVDTPSDHGTGTGKSYGSGFVNGPSDKQLAYVEALCKDRGLVMEDPDDDEVWPYTEPKPTTKKAASEVIERLLKTPKVPKAVPPGSSQVKKQPTIVATVPAGYYALDGSGKNAIVFYRVDVPDKGKWQGYTFVKLVVGGRVDSNVPREQKAGILARIEEAGIKEATIRYGQEIGKCGMCNRPLTDDLSRQMGIGPVCREKA